MKVLVTGATGFLGSQFSHRLAELGYKVRVLVRRSSDTSDLPPSAEIEFGDITALDSVLRACDGCDAVFHMAALVSAWWPDMDEFEKVNVGGLENVLQAMRSFPTLKTLVYTSSFFALGPTDGTIGDSRKEHRGSGFCTEYERSKYLAEGVARRAVQDESLNVIVVYPGVIYGPGKISQANLMVKLLVDHFHGKFPGFAGSAQSKFSFVHINDVMHGHLAALEKGQPGEKYILGGENASLIDFFNIVEEISGKPAPKLHVPFWLLSIVGFFSAVYAKYCGGPVPIFTHESIRAFKHDWAFSSEVAEEVLGYNPLSLKDGLRETMSWLNGTGVISF